MRTLVVSHDVMDPHSSKLRGLLRTLVDSQGPSAATFADAEHMLSQAQAELVVVVLSPEPEPGLAAEGEPRSAAPLCEEGGTRGKPWFPS